LRKLISPLFLHLLISICPPKKRKEKHNCFFDWFRINFLLMLEILSNPNFQGYSLIYFFFLSIFVFLISSQIQTQESSAMNNITNISHKHWVFKFSFNIRLKRKQKLFQFNILQIILNTRNCIAEKTKIIRTQVIHTMSINILLWK